LKRAFLTWVPGEVGQPSGAVVHLRKVPLRRGARRREAPAERLGQSQRNDTSTSAWRWLVQGLEDAGGSVETRRPPRGTRRAAMRSPTSGEPHSRMLPEQKGDYEPHPAPLIGSKQRPYGRPTAASALSMW